MIQNLKIQNYALIKHLDIDFEKGMSVLTGETGAGKSIIIGALGLLMGQRADTKTIREGEQKCIIEGTFILPEKKDNLRQALWFDEMDIEYDTQCIIRREINVNGKSRTFINDTPAQLNQLKELASWLIDIHSQHENLLLRNDDFQRDIVDAVAGNGELVRQYEKEYKNYKKLLNDLQQLTEQKENYDRTYDYVKFQYDQLEQTHLQPDELEALETEQQQLEHTEDILSALSTAISLLDYEESGVCQALKECVNRLKHVEHYLPSLPQLKQRLDSSSIEINDILSELTSLQEHTSFDPERLQIVEERIDLINNLLQKHHVQDTKQLLELKEQFAQTLEEHDNFDERLNMLNKQLAEQKEQLSSLANRLTGSRKKACPTIVAQVEKDLKTLGIQHARIEIRITPLADFTGSGIDDVRIFFAANKNQTLRPAQEIASGGEIARLMLCLKSITTQQQAIGTIVFDEVDTGVSGEVASNMGEIMRAMSEHRQVIVITHLPQIAAKGQQHYKVYKQDGETMTETHIKRLNNDERIEELAHLLSGDTLTQAALDNAKALLKI